jgi:selenocysteine-specific elongation factor
MSSSRATKNGSGGSLRGLVLGTAGHIDHGKTALIRALTGTDCDRLPEEKQRGITIDLGFAALDLGGDAGRVSVVDVPGHERFVRTMVSGASGIDFVLLVVAADEGVMPQTREHVAIAQLLGLDRGVVALTKRDLVDDEMAELASEDVRDLLADTTLAAAPIVACSSTTGDGLDALRAALASCALATPARTSRSGPPRLGIDRVFAVKGFGTVITGTLVGAPLRTGEAVEVHPIGLRTRIRGLQSHGESVEEARPGTRTAANLQGVEVGQLSRGEVVSLAGALAPTRVCDVKLHWLGSAPASDETVSIELLSGTAERRARMTPIGPHGFTPGSTSYARIHIDGDPLPLLPGDRFVARGFARNDQHGATLGGGVVLDIAPPHRRLSDPGLQDELNLLEQRDPLTDLRTRILRTGLEGTRADTLVRETGQARDEVERHLDELEAADSIHRADGDLAVGHAAIGRLESALAQAVDAFHAAEPLRRGIPSGTLRGALPDNVATPAADLAIARLAARAELIVESDLVRRPDHAPRLDGETQVLVERIRNEAKAAGLDPPPPREWSERLGIDLARFRDLVAHLEREQALVRAPGDLWFDRSSVDALVVRVRGHLAEHGAIDTATYKQLTGTSRRTTVPLMELLDELHVTRRDGDQRVTR